MPTKLRASCDRCHFAKVRCIKRGHRCQHCELSGEQCKYSPALPRIYHRNRRRRSISGNPISTPLTSSQPAVRGKDFDDQVIGHSNFPIDSLPASTSTFEHRIYDTTVSELNAFFWPSTCPNSVAGSHLPNSVQPPSDVWPNENTPTTPLSLNTLESTNLSLPLEASSRTSLTRASNSPSIRNPPSPESTPPPTTLCSCFPRLLNAMQCMNAHTGARSPALDTVLCANRKAVRHCLASLQCKYGLAVVDNVNCSSIACGLLDRILASYQAALDNFCEGMDGEKSNEHSEEDGEIEEERSTIQVRIGAFAVRKSEQALCAREIVAREIERLQGALEGQGTDGRDIRSALISNLSVRCLQMLDAI